MIILRSPPTSTINLMRHPRRYASRLSSRMPSLSCSSSSSQVSTTTTTPTTATATATPTPVEAAPKPWLLVGLGNPGKMYQGTRHNVGFEMLDAIAEAEGISMSNVSFKALFGKGRIGNVPVILAKPQTFMNLSGESVGSIVSYYKIPVKQVLVIFDDLDLPFASLRLLPKGGHGGHNGMRSIIQRFTDKDNRDRSKDKDNQSKNKGNCDFPRLRIGIGRPPGKMEPASFVLRPFNKQERQELDFTFQDGVEAVRILLLEGFDKSATFVNSKKTLKQLN